MMIKEHAKSIIKEALSSSNLQNRRVFLETAEELGVSPRTLESWKNGKTIPPGDQLIRLATKLEIEEKLFCFFSVPDGVHLRRQMNKIEEHMEYLANRMSDIAIDVNFELDRGQI